MVDCSSWHVVQTHPSREEIACNHLSRQGFDAFLPKLRSSRRTRQGRSKGVLRPLFPGYVFASFDPSTVRWQAIDSTIGVSRLVRFGDRPAKLEAGLVERLKHLSSNGYVAFQDEIQPDDTVRILSGPFDQWIGRVASLSEGNRAVVLLQMATRSVNIEIDREGLVKTA